MFDPFTQKMLHIIDRLEKTTQYTAADAARTRIDPKHQKGEYRRMGKKIWKFTVTREIWDWPDNCETDDDGNPRIRDNEKKTTITPKWQGNTLQSVLNDEERQFLLIYRLTTILSDQAYRKIDEMELLKAHKSKSEYQIMTLHPIKEEETQQKPKTQTRHFSSGLFSRLSLRKLQAVSLVLTLLIFWCAWLCKPELEPARKEVPHEQSKNRVSDLGFSGLVKQWEDSFTLDRVVVYEHLPKEAFTHRERYYSGAPLSSRPAFALTFGELLLGH